MSRGLSGSERCPFDLGRVQKGEGTGQKDEGETRHKVRM